MDLTTGAIIASDGFVGRGSFQNAIVGAQVDQAGEVFACASWGDEVNSHPEVRIYDRALNLIGSIDTEGSPYDIDLTPTGRFVLVGSKAVNANTFGSGWRTQAYEVESSCDADFNGDGVVDTRDVLAFLNTWNAQDPTSDCDSNDVIDTRDVLCFLNVWSTGC